jgi:hypothetical protein
MAICRRAMIAFPVQLFFLLSSAANAFSQVRGVYSPGSTLTGGGTVVSPGFSYSNQLWYGASSQLRGPRGNIVLGESPAGEEGASSIRPVRCRLLLNRGSEEQA